MGKKLGLVHCRICKKSIDRNVEKEGIDWIMPSRNFFYHKSCYDSWKHDNSNIKAVKQDEEWIPYIWDFLSREIKVKYDYRKCDSQRKNFIKKYNYTNKGIFFALKYYYEVKNNNWEKSEGGIGILPFVYKDSCAYWEEQYLKQKDILIVIEKQMEERAQREKVRIRKKDKKPKWVSQIEEIGEMLDE